MGNLKVNWTPASGGTAQRVFARAKGTTSWDANNFNAPNDQAANATSAVYQNALPNAVTQFKVNSICGNVLGSDSEIVEGVAFGCYNIVVSNISYDSFTTTVSGISNDVVYFAFMLYDDTNTLISENPITITGGVATFNFSGLDNNTTYYVGTKIEIQVTNDGVTTEIEHTSEDVCLKEVITLDNSWEINYSNNDNVPTIGLLVGNNNTSPSTSIFSGNYSIDPTVGTNANLPLTNGNVLLTISSGYEITNATCNGELGAISMDGLSASFSNVYGSLIVTFITTP